MAVDGNDVEARAAQLALEETAGGWSHGLAGVAPPRRAVRV